jgi:hypothetical protein
MPYYFFNNCPESSLEKIAQLCESSGLSEIESESPDRYWAHADNSPIWFVRYYSDSETPLLLQTPPKFDYQNPQVLKFMKQLLSDSQSTQIYDGCYPKKPMDMSVFK